MHSSSVGPIDETQLFYLESRGIPPDEARKFIVLGFLEPVVARVPLAAAQARLRELLEASGPPARWWRQDGRLMPPPSSLAPMRRIDLLGVDEVGDGEMKMAWVDGTDQVLVINQGGEFTAVQGICSHEYFELDKGFLTNGTLTCALHLSRFDLSERRAPRSRRPTSRWPSTRSSSRMDACSSRCPDGPLEISEVALVPAGTNGPMASDTGPAPTVDRTMQGVEFQGFAGDCTIAGQVTMFGERLTDFLNGQERFRLHHVAVHEPRGRPRRRARFGEPGA